MNEGDSQEKKMGPRRAPLHGKQYMYTKCIVLLGHYSNTSDITVMPAMLLLAGAELSLSKGIITDYSALQGM